MLRKTVIVILLLLFSQVANATTQLPKTGQTTCYDSAGAAISCTGTGQDGELQSGVNWPTPRFVDMGDGTVKDNFTGLIWLKDINCLPNQLWADAFTSVKTVHDGQCGLTDGSASGDWRLPNVNEMESLVDLSQNDPALPAGTPFSRPFGGFYWTSTSHSLYTGNAWAIWITSGTVQAAAKIGDLYWVWPVKGVQ
jgi:hypothetical protein